MWLFAQPSTGYFAFLLLCSCYCLFIADQDVSFYATLLAYPSAWTFQEYWIHRALMHGSTGAVQLSHMGHHSHPRNLTRIFIPCIFTAVSAIINALVCAYLFSTMVAKASIVANVACYFMFEWAHILCHNETSSTLTAKIRSHHQLHHSIKGRDVNFGFTSAAWDIAFGTYASASDHFLGKCILCIPCPVVPMIIYAVLYRVPRRSTRCDGADAIEDLKNRCDQAAILSVG